MKSQTFLPFPTWDMDHLFVQNVHIVYAAHPTLLKLHDSGSPEADDLPLDVSLEHQ